MPYIHSVLSKRKTFQIEQVNEGGDRHYRLVLKDGDFKFPSVTRILGKIGNAKIEQLQSSMDPAVWDYVCDRGVTRGSVMHRYLENYLMHYQTTKDIQRSLEFTQYKTPTDEAEIVKYKSKFFSNGRDLFYNFYYSGWFNEIKEVLIIEQPLCSAKYKFAGTSDYAYVNKQNQVIIGDFKSSSHKKTDEEILSYKIQISAYCVAINEMYGLVPHKGEIRISYDNTVDVFEVLYEDAHKYLDGDFKRIANELYEKINGK